MVYKTFEEFQATWGWPTHDAVLIKVGNVREELKNNWIFFIAQIRIQEVAVVYIEKATSGQIQSWVDKSYALVKVLLGK